MEVTVSKMLGCDGIVLQVAQELIVEFAPVITPVFAFMLALQFTPVYTHEFLRGFTLELSLRTPLGLWLGSPTSTPEFAPGAHRPYAQGCGPRRIGQYCCLDYSSVSLYVNSL